MAKMVLQNVTKSFTSHNVVSDVNMNIKESELFVLLGPSGAGKTTLLRMIAGLETIDHGDFILNGKRMNDVHGKDRGISMVFQSWALFPHMNAFDNIAFGLSYKGLSKDEIFTRIKEAASLLKISHLLDRLPHKLSGGEQQRVSIARAIVHRADVLLMDEPFSNLDAKLRVLMQHELATIHKELNMTIIFVTHDQKEAMALADRIAVMQEGRILQTATPDELYDHPQDTFVADFIGETSMNLIKGVYEKQRFSFDGCCIELPYVSKLNKYEGKEMIMGVRPEDIHFTIHEKGIPFKTLKKKRIMNSYLWYGTCKVQEILVSTNCEENAKSNKIIFNLDRVNFYDPESKQRIVV